MSWEKAENSNNIKPAEIDKESSNSVVYVRKDFTLIAATNERPEHYEYYEKQIAKEDWETYETIISHDSQLSDTELAIVEIYEMITKMEG